MVQRLLDEGKADPNVTDHEANTPLYHAVELGNANLIKHLLRHGADVHFQNLRKKTPQEVAETLYPGKDLADLLRVKVVHKSDHVAPVQSMMRGSSLNVVDELYDCKFTQILVTEIYAVDNSDRYWTFAISVHEILYGQTSLEERLRRLRPIEVSNISPICTWIHVPQNNMMWVEDLLGRLGLGAEIWQREKGVPANPSSQSIRNRAVTPHVSIYSNYRSGSLFVPFISYENFHRQMKRQEILRDVDDENSMTAIRTA